jgi:glycerophosphoryl diester phosphodiesterase
VARWVFTSRNGHVRHPERGGRGFASWHFRAAAADDAGMDGAVRPVPAISAHRGGGENARAGTYEAYRSALAAGAEYAEFDVRRTADGTLVVFHRARAGWGRAVAGVSYARLCDLAGYEVPRMAEVMRLLAGRAVGHLDLKEPGGAAVIVARALDLLGPGGVVVTTDSCMVAASLRRRFPAVPIGLTVGGDLGETVRFTARRARARARGRGLSRLDRVLVAAADWAVVHHRLARTGVLEECRMRGIRTMVWTVNSDRALARWLASPSVDVLVTDRPARAVGLRGQRRLAGG